MGRLPLAYQCGEVLREVDGLGDLGLLRLELGELLGLRLGALGRTAEHEPRRPAWCQGLGRGLGHHGQGLAPALAAWRQPLSLAEATDIGGHTAIAARVALGLELPKQLDGRPTPGIPALEEIVCIRVEHAASVVATVLGLRPHRHLEIPLDGPAVLHPTCVAMALMGYPWRCKAQTCS